MCNYSFMLFIRPFHQPKDIKFYHSNIHHTCTVMLHPVLCDGQQVTRNNNSSVSLEQQQQHLNYVKAVNGKINSSGLYSETQMACTIGLIYVATLLPCWQFVLDLWFTGHYLFSS